MPTINLGVKPKRDITYSKREAQKIYQDKRWKILRTEKLRINPLCEECERKDKTTLADEVHHIIPFSQGKTPMQRDYLAFDIDNLESLCTDCHNSKH